MTKLLIATLCVVAALVANSVLELDTDHGGYRPSIWNRAGYPKAYVHGVTAFALVVTGYLLGLPLLPWAGVVICAAVVWEFTQGFFNWLDVVAGVVAVAVAVLLIDSPWW